jgi:hypothetical protein
MTRLWCHSPWHSKYVVLSRNESILWADSRFSGCVGQSMPRTYSSSISFRRRIPMRPTSLLILLVKYVNGSFPSPMLYRLLSSATNIAQLCGLLLSVFHFSEESRRSLRTTEIHSLKFGFRWCAWSLLDPSLLGPFFSISHAVLCVSCLVSIRYIAIMNNTICRRVLQFD